MENSNSENEISVVQQKTLEKYVDENTGSNYVGTIKSMLENSINFSPLEKNLQVVKNDLDTMPTTKFFCTKNLQSTIVVIDVTKQQIDDVGNSLEKLDELANSVLSINVKDEENKMHTLEGFNWYISNEIVHTKKEKYQHKIEVQTWFCTPCKSTNPYFDCKYCGCHGLYCGKCGYYYSKTIGKDENGKEKPTKITQENGEIVVEYNECLCNKKSSLVSSYQDLLKKYEDSKKLCSQQKEIIKQLSEITKQLKKDTKKALENMVSISADNKSLLDSLQQGHTSLVQNLNTDMAVIGSTFQIMNALANDKIKFQQQIIHFIEEHEKRSNEEKKKLVQAEAAASKNTMDKIIDWHSEKDNLIKEKYDSEIDNTSNLKDAQFEKKLVEVKMRSSMRSLFAKLCQKCSVKGEEKKNYLKKLDDSKLDGVSYADLIEQFITDDAFE